MSAPQGWKIDPTGARNRRKATGKIRRNPPIHILPLIRKVKHKYKSRGFVIFLLNNTNFKYFFPCILKQCPWIFEIMSFSFGKITTDNFDIINMLTSWF